MSQRKSSLVNKCYCPLARQRILLYHTGMDTFLIYLHSLYSVECILRRLNCTETDTRLHSTIKSHRRSVLFYLVHVYLYCTVECTSWYCKWCGKYAAEPLTRILHLHLALTKETKSRDFWFFHESISPQPQSIPFGQFQIFSQICGDIRKSRCTTGINDTGVNFREKKFETTQMVYSGAWGKLIHEKNQKLKIS
jgi:hypothetical protein